jgi:hypothetical protein
LQVYVDNHEALSPSPSPTDNVVSGTIKKRRSKGNTTVTASDIPEDYVIPTNPTGLFPIHMTGAPLGEFVRRIQRRELYFDLINVKKWKKVGIHFERTKATVSYKALSIYPPRAPPTLSLQLPSPSPSSAFALNSVPSGLTSVATSISSHSSSPVLEVHDNAAEGDDMELDPEMEKDSQNRMRHDGLKRKRSEDTDSEGEGEESSDQQEQIHIYSPTTSTSVVVVLPPPPSVVPASLVIDPSCTWF